MTMHRPWWMILLETPLEIPLEISQPARLPAAECHAKVRDAKVRKERPT